MTEEQIGTIKSAKEIGKLDDHRYIYHACVNCGKKRWVKFIDGNPIHTLCKSCKQLGASNSNWKGGRKKSSHGYTMILLCSSDFFYPMANVMGYVSEHRLIIAKYLNHCLHSWEIVHHKNHIRDDNRIENLQLVTDDRHKQITILENRIKHLEQRVTLLEAELALKEANYARTD
jgi:hypothetical protein